MPSIEYFVVAEDYSIDQVTNRMSIFCVLEELHAQALPVLIDVSAITAWRIAENELGSDHQAILRVHRPGSAPFDWRANFCPRQSRHRITQRIQGIPVETPGQIRFEMLINGQHAADHVVDVTIEGGGTGAEPVDPQA